MKKKIAIICLMCLLLVFLTGCSQKIIDEKGDEHELYFGLACVNNLGNGSKICYDTNTKICYIVIDVVYQAGVSPYYVIGENGEPEIAVYGVNYK